MIENCPNSLCQAIDPFVPTKTQGPAIDWLGRKIAASYGMQESGYDIRLAGPVTCIAGRMVFGLALEHLSVPSNMRVRCDDKSTNLRMGIRVAGRAEPGWRGHLTIEVMYIPVEGGPSILALPAGWGIATLEFGLLKECADYGNGKYQDAQKIMGAI